MPKREFPKNKQTNSFTGNIEKIKKREIFLARLAGKFTDSHIGRKLGISAQTVYDYRKKHGIQKAPLKKRKRTKRGQAKTQFTQKRNLPTMLDYENRFLKENKRKPKNTIEVYVFNNLRTDEVIRLEKLRIKELRRQGFSIRDENEIIMQTLEECKRRRQKKMSARERI